MAKTRPIVEVDPRFDTAVKLMCARVASGKPLFGPDDNREVFIETAEEGAVRIHRRAQSRQWIPGPDDIVNKADMALDICRRLKQLGIDSQGKPDVDRDELVNIITAACQIV